MSCGPIDERLAVFVLGYITDSCLQFRMGRPGFSQPRLPASADGNLASRRHKSLGHGVSDAAGAAGNQNRVVGQLHVGSLPDSVLGITYRLGEEDALFGPQLKRFGEAGSVAIVEPRRQTIGCG